MCRLVWRLVRRLRRGLILRLMMFSMSIILERICYRVKDWKHGEVRGYWDEGSDMMVLVFSFGNAVLCGLRLNIYFVATRRVFLTNEDRKKAAQSLNLA